MNTLLWGLLAVICGAFFCIYGFTLFRWALLAIGFLIGFSLAMRFTAGQTTGLQLIISFVAGGALAALLYFMANFAIYIAGGLVGLIVALLLSSILNSWGIDSAWLTVFLLLVGIGLCGYFGKSLGELIIIFAAAAVGAYSVVYGLALLFPEELGMDIAETQYLPISTLTVTLLLTVGIISGLAQYQIFDLRQRLRGRPGL
jgi:hypothetical protein